ncbi:Glutamate receptor-like 19 [Homarus americanus]|uniref:Glutamate receptor-like 19 n=1 Tax=Homarus americanus TaxID=6706 RepID=A0A8J5MM00_HOMAM|nr:Glutamate receptor-like 19 [Homarus americanus]
MVLVADIVYGKTYFFVRYQLLPAPGNLWGGPLPNGSWTGMLGMLQRQEVELAIAPFFVTDQREMVCDFSDPVYIDHQSILMVRPQIQSDLSGFFKPFTSQVWILVLMSLVLVIAAMNSVVRCEARIFHIQHTSTCSKITLWVIKALSQESSEWLPKKDGGRLIVTTWLLASLVFMSSYSGILTAMLTVPRVTIPIDSLEDLVSQTDLPWRLEAASMMYSFFEESEEDIGRKVFAEKVGTFQDCWAARQNIASGEFAAICDSTTMMKAMSWDFRCHLYISREKAYSNGILSIAFKTKSRYLSQVNKILAHLKETGHLGKWLGEQITNTSVCLKPPSADIGDGISPLNLQAFAGPFLVLLVAVIRTGWTSMSQARCVKWEHHPHLPDHHHHLSGHHLTCLVVTSTYLDITSTYLVITST